MLLLVLLVWSVLYSDQSIIPRVNETNCKRLTGHLPNYYNGYDVGNSWHTIRIPHCRHGGHHSLAGSVVWLLLLLVVVVNGLRWVDWRISPRRTDDIETLLCSAASRRKPLTLTPSKWTQLGRDGSGTLAGWWMDGAEPPDTYID